MRIVFVHVGREHLGIEYLSSALKLHGYDVRLVYDAGLFSRDDNVFYSPFLESLFSRKKLLADQVKEHKPDLVAFSAYTNNYRLMLELAREIKYKLTVPVVFGGIHSTLVPEEVIGHNFIDFLIAGEGEHPFLELASALKGNLPVNNIKNLWYKADGKIVRNDLRPVVSDLDSLPFPDKDLFKEEIKYRDDYMIMANRGCIYSCSYCCESYMNRAYPGKYFRKRGIESIISELSVMKGKYNFKRVMFFDSILFTDAKWLSGLLAEYKKEIAVPFRCIGHVNFASYETIKSLKDAGCYCVEFGVQTFNENVRKNVLNRFETNRQIEKALSICDKLKLRYDVDLMFGIPSVSDEDYRLSLEFMSTHRYLNRIKCFYLSYFPKLSIVNKAREHGILSDDDIDKIGKGDIGDWFHLDSIKDAEHREWRRDFEKLYKIYPILPFFLLRSILKYKTYRLFHLIPDVLVIFIQLIIGIFKKDYRFGVYINKYFCQYKNLFLRKMNTLFKAVY